MVYIASFCTQIWTKQAPSAFVMYGIHKHTSFLDESFVWSLTYVSFMWSKQLLVPKGQGLVYNQLSTTSLSTIQFNCAPLLLLFTSRYSSYHLYEFTLLSTRKYVLVRLYIICNSMCLMDVFK